MKCVNASYWQNPKNREKHSNKIKDVLKNKDLRSKIGKAVSKSLNRPEIKDKISGANSHHWKGDSIGYHALHSWLLKTYGKPTKCENGWCNKKSRNYTRANISGEYKRDINDFLELCRSCHSKFDRGQEVLIKGKLMKKGDK